MSTFFHLVTCLSLTAAIRIRIRNDMNPEGISWENMVDELIRVRDLWQAQGISEYTYKFSISCFCLPCTFVDKFVYIVDGEAKDVEFDMKSAEQWDTKCTDSDLWTPIADNYFSIDQYFEKAINFATDGMEANCTDTDEWGWGDQYCGGTVEFEYDETLYYPTSLSLNYGPRIADGDMSYTFGCLSVMNTDSSAIISNLDQQDGECGGYKPPTNPSDLCVCTLEYIPYCCDGKTYGNKCHAECSDYVVYTDCVQSECDGDGGIVIHRPGSKGDSDDNGEDCVCSREYDPYCCDGEVYDNSCIAECASFDVSTECVSSDQCQGPEGMMSKVAPLSSAMCIHVLSFLAAIYALF